MTVVGLDVERWRRRRWLVAGIAMVVAALVLTAVAATMSSTGAERPGIRLPKALPPQAVGLPTGGVQSLKSARAACRHCHRIALRRR
jgi:hypothetical protein